MCEACLAKDKLIEGMRTLVNSQQANIVLLIEAMDAMKPHLPEYALPFVDRLTAQTKALRPI